MSEASHRTFSIPVSPFAQKLGIVCDRVERDRAVYLMEYHDDNVTFGDVVHGGAISSLADVAATGAAWSTVADPARFRGATIDLSLSFVAAARSAALLADARVVKRGGTVCFVDVEVRNRGDGDLVAVAKAIYKLSRVETAEEKLVALFSGRSEREQMAVLAALERSGAALYRTFASNATDATERQALIASAQREEANAETLEQVLSR